MIYKYRVGNYKKLRKLVVNESDILTLRVFQRLTLWLGPLWQFFSVAKVGKAE